MVLVLVQTSFVGLFQFLCFLFQLVVSTLVTGFCWSLFSEIILDICELILFLPGFRAVMQYDDAITCVLASPSLPPFRGIKSKGKLYWGKNKKYVCKRDDSRGKVLLWLSWVLPVEQLVISLAIGMMQL